MLPLLLLLPLPSCSTSLSESISPSHSLCWSSGTEQNSAAEHTARTLYGKRTNEPREPLYGDGGGGGCGASATTGTHLALVSVGDDVVNRE